ncbi:MAG: hypothetical protein ACFCD0_02160 [Gemmataceae bacterium]
MPMWWKILDAQGWNVSVSAEDMLGVVEKRISDRKLRLFGLACCRRHMDLWEEFWDGPLNKITTLFSLVEKYAEGELVEDAFVQSVRDFGVGTDLVNDIFACEDLSPWDSLYLCLVALTRTSRSERVMLDLLQVSYHMAGALDVEAYEQEDRAQADLLRELVPNPFETFSIEPTWLTETVVNLAKSIYQHQHFGELPILADALEEAGCTDTRILDHFREKRGHLRACWALDLILGKE